MLKLFLKMCFDTSDLHCQDVKGLLLLIFKRSFLKTTKRHTALGDVYKDNKDINQFYDVVCTDNAFNTINYCVTILFNYKMQLLCHFRISSNFGPDNHYNESLSENRKGQRQVFHISLVQL